MPSSNRTLPEPIVRILLRDHVALPPSAKQCRAHASVKVLERPIDCPMCSYDVREVLRAALAANEFLDRWRTDMLNALETS